VVFEKKTPLPSLCSESSDESIRSLPCYTNSKERNQSPKDSATGKLRFALSKLVNTWALDLVSALLSPGSRIPVNQLSQLWQSGDKARSVPSLLDSTTEWAKENKDSSILYGLGFRSIVSLETPDVFYGKQVPMSDWCVVNEWNPAPTQCARRPIKDGEKKIDVIMMFQEVMERLHRMIDMPSPAYERSKRFQQFYDRLRKERKDLRLPELTFKKAASEAKDPFQVFDEVAEEFCRAGKPMSKSVKDRLSFWKTKGSCTGGLDAWMYLVSVAAAVIRAQYSKNREGAYRLWEELRVSDALLCFLGRISGNSYSKDNFPTCFAISKLADGANAKAKEQKKGGAARVSKPARTWREVWNQSFMEQ
jgi:hypothetical protein